MDTSDVRRKAIPYYACYIAKQLTREASTTTEQLAIDSWLDGNNPGEGQLVLNDDDLIEDAVKYLEEANIIRSLPDEFGPHLIVAHPNLVENRNKLYAEENSVFQKYRLAGDGRVRWLNQALLNIDRRIKGEQHKLAVSSTSLDVWEPIPLDRSDRAQEQATEALDRIIEGLRGDNGYAATNAQEKAFVQDKLSAVTKRLKEDSQISWMYLLEFAFKPLEIVVKRFGGAAIGIAASAAKDSLAAWLKSKGVSFLDDLFK